MAVYYLFIALIVTSGLIYSDALSFDAPPDVMVLSTIAKAIWENRDDVMFEVAQIFGIPLEDIKLGHQDLLLNGDEEAGFGMDCTLCLTFVGGIQGFIRAGLEFEDVRDFAVEVCKNVSVGLGYDGDIICDGVIDVFGPHVYYVANETDMGPREVCEFHRSCSSSQVTTQKATTKSNILASQRIPSSENRQRIRKSKKQMMKIAHITDVHMDPKYAPGSPSECDLPLCCRDYWPGTGEAPQWGTYGCELPLQTMNVMLKFIADQQVDMVINTGDTPNHALWEETQEGQLWQSQALADGIKEFMPSVAAHQCLGNHDTYPTNLFYGPSPLTQDLLHEIRLIYQDLSNFTDEQAATFEDGGYYITEILPGLKLMSYNGIYGITRNYYGVLLQDAPDWNNMMEFMEREFSIARDNGDKLILLCHNAMGGGFDFWDVYLNDIMMRYGDLSILHLFGHSHKDFYKMALDEDGNAIHVNSVTGAVTTKRNPTFKIYYLDTETYIPMEFDTYFINITRPVAEGEEPVIELLYNSFVDYGMEDLTPASFQNFTDRMELDDDLLYMFRWNEIGRVSDPGPCDDNCRKDFFCERRTTSRVTKKECKNG